MDMKLFRSTGGKQEVFRNDISGKLEFKIH